MLALLSRDQVRALDRDAIERLGVPGVVLMENAGAQAARLLCEAFSGALSRVLIVGGPGQNGGDAWVIARHLRCRGYTPRCFLLGERERVKGDARVNLDALAALGQSVEPLISVDELESALRSTSLVIDGLFGTGLDRALSGLPRAVVEAINAAGLPVVALDLPSGVDADTGQVLGVAIQAALTVTFAARKPGLLLYPGAGLAGSLHCVSIGVPLAPGPDSGVIEASDVAGWLPPRAPDSHKGTNGHVLVIAGSPGKTGAALLSASAALRTGAGLVTLASEREARQALDYKVVELMTAELGGVEPLADALALAQGKAACVVGPGLGLDEATQEFVRALSLALALPTVLDADALSAWAGGVSGLQQARGPRVLTPHPGEASRLLGVSTQALQADRVGAARALARSSGHVVVLKGARTVVAAANGAVRICTSGTPAMGSAGTGDVLAGVIGALCAQLPPFDAAACGVELHARAGQLAAIGDRGLVASDLLPALPRALVALRAELAQMA
jgi:NAD(P)H-hydrate epimerase